MLRSISIRFALAFSLVALVACSDSDDDVEAKPPASSLSAEIRRTEYGIPHITANDWASLGYGYGYAYAQDNFCIAMRQIVSATSRSAELLGEEEGDVVSDFVLRAVLGTKAEFRERLLGDTGSEAYQLGSGLCRRYEPLPGGDRGRKPGGG